MSTKPTHYPHIQLTNQQFYAKCVHIGKTAKTAVREFLALLPEVEDRQAYLEHGMSSIFEFATKLGGVSREQVLLTLRLDQKFEDLPHLKQALLSAEVPIHKLARVAYMATAETQDFWLTQTKLLTQQALETLVRDTKSMRTHVSNPNKTAKVQKVEQSDGLNLSPKIRGRLLAIQNKGLDLNQVLEELLDQREQKIQQEKQQIVGKIEEKATQQGAEPLSRSRYIPKKIKNVLQQEFGKKCAHSNCNNVASNIHHTRRFGLDASPNPFYLALLCKLHHEISHVIDLKSVQKRNLLDKSA